MSKDKFYCFDFTIVSIEGRENSVDPTPSKCGITQEEYDTYNQNQGIPTHSVFEITDLEAKIIYDRNYWTPLQCGAMPWPVNYVFFQFALNLTTVAIQTMQTILQAKPTGWMDHYTMDLLFNQEPELLAQKILDSQRKHYQEHDKQYLTGLLVRCNHVAQFCDLT